MSMLAYRDERPDDLVQALDNKAAELSRANRELAEKERLLRVYHQMGRIILASPDLDQVLDNLSQQLIDAGIFSSVMIALVDEHSQEVEVVRNFARRKGDGDKRTFAREHRPEDLEMAREVERTGAIRCCEGEREPAERPDGVVDRRGDKVYYFIPVKKEDRVLAILATDSGSEDKDETLKCISVMSPLLDQVAVALEHTATNRKVQEAQFHLIQAEKMVSLGQLAAGVAHEINNPVGFVSSNIATLKEYIDTFKKLVTQYEELALWSEDFDDEQSRQILQNIETIRGGEEWSFMVEDIDALLVGTSGGLHRIKDIVQGLRSFTRLDRGQLEEADINQQIQATLKIVWNELKHKCRVHQKLGKLPPIRCNPGQLNQVFLNLLTNAGQAIEKRGEIRIATSATDRQISVHIADTGSGIPPAIKSRIFEPFFTTKQVGHGTGLGLAISYGIIQAHKGQIRVESEEGKGSEFIIELPLGAD